MHLSRVIVILVVALALRMCPPVPQMARAEEPAPPNSDAEYRKKVLAAEQDALKKREEGYKALEVQVKAMQAEREKNSVPLTGEITIDEDKREVKEPRTMEEALGFTGERRVRDEYEVSPEDFDIAVHDRWALNASDFKLDDPQYITGERVAGSSKTWFGFIFSITNSTTKARRIAPVFTAVTDRGTFNLAAGGYLPERMLANSSFRPLAGSEKLADKELLAQGIPPLESVADMLTGGPEKPGIGLKPAYTFEPGQTRWGAALWPEFDNHFRELTIIVSGLTNAHRYEEKMRRVLTLSFERNSDGYNVTRSELKYKGKRWDYLWMWDQDITVPIPTDAKDPQIKAQKLQTPAGAERYVWAFPFELKNSTKVNQEIAIKNVAFVCPVEVEVGGAKVPLEVRVDDDGASSIYKAQLMKAIGAETVKDRFQNKTLVDGSKTAVERRTITLEPGKTADKNWAAFDAADVDWDKAIADVENSLSRGFDKAALSKQSWERTVKLSGGDEKMAAKNPGIFYNPHRALNQDEIKSVKEQILKAIPEAVEKARSRKTVTAYFNCVSGMASGEHRVSRNYRQIGVVDDSWLKEWEGLDK